MEPQKSAANRVRHILQAMERSIDTARSRRVGNPAAPEASPSSATTHDRAANHAAVTSANTAAIPVAKSNVPAAPAQMMIGAPSPAKPVPSSTMSPNANPHVARDGQPPRLKAKPKRFEGTFNSPFSPPTAYRSQTG